LFKEYLKTPLGPWGSCCPWRFPQLPRRRRAQQKAENSAAGVAGRPIFSLLLGSRPRPPDGETQNRTLFPTRRVPPSQSPPFASYGRSRFAKPQNPKTPRAQRRNERASPHPISGDGGGGGGAQAEGDAAWRRHPVPNSNAFPGLRNGAEYCIRSDGIRPMACRHSKSPSRFCATRGFVQHEYSYPEMGVGAQRRGTLVHSG